MVSFFLKLCIFTKWPNASKWFCTEGFPVIFHDRLWLCSNPWPYILELGSHVFRLPASNTGTLDLTLSNSPARIWSVCPCGTHSFRLLNPEVWLKVERPYGLSGKFAHWRSLRERTKLPSKNGTRTWHLKDSTNQLSEKSVPKPLPPLFYSLSLVYWSSILYHNLKVLSATASLLTSGKKENIVISPSRLNLGVRAG